MRWTTINTTATLVLANIMALCQQFHLHAAERVSPQRDDSRTTRSYWLKDAYASDVADAMKKRSNSERQQESKPAVFVADTKSNVLFADVPTADFAEVDRRIQELDARPKSIWFDCVLTRESKAGSVVLSRPKLICLVGIDGSTTLSVGDEASAQRYSLAIKVTSLQNDIAAVEATVSFEETSRVSTDEAAFTTRSVRICRNVKLNSSAELSVPCDENHQNVAKVRISARKSGKSSVLN